MKKILFISHDANRSGAQLLLLQLLNWIKHLHTEITFEIILGGGGELKILFEELASTKLWRFYPAKSLNPIIRYKKKKQILKYKRKSFDLIYSNTFVNGIIINDLKEICVPIITHVHEMDYWINNAGEQNLKYVKLYTNKFIAASNAVKDCLVNNFFIEPSKINIIYEYVSFNELTKNNKLSLRDKLNLPANAIIIGASGAEIWRKGKDWFIPLALDVISKKPEMNIHFIWIGGYLNNELNHDYNLINEKNKIHFITHIPNANNYFHDFDVFVMLSREDPFPVVNLEAASFGVPIICFDKSGGTRELIENGCGYIVPYGNLSEFADKIIYLLNNPKIRKQMGNAALNTVKEKFDINIIAQQILEFINN